HQAIGDRRRDQPDVNFVGVELAAGDELMQTEACAIERMIATTREGIGELRDLALERGPAVSARARRSVRQAGQRALRKRRTLAGGQPVWRDGERLLVVPSIARTIRVHGRRRQDVAAVTTNIETDGDAADA